MYLYLLLPEEEINILYKSQSTEQLIAENITFPLLYLRLNYSALL